MNAPAIQLDKVVLVREGHLILADANMTIDSGEFVALSGPNGAGKTSLLRSLLGLIRPAKGTIHVLGRLPLRRNPDVGYLPQLYPSLAELHLDGFGFVAAAHGGDRWGLPLARKIRASAVSAALRAANAEHLASRDIARISGGELQRLKVAQALLGHPRLLLLDEPMQGLDLSSQQALMTLMETLRHDYGVTVLLTVHEPRWLSVAFDRIMHLEAGRLINLPRATYV